MTRGDVATRFWLHVDQPLNGCWEWKGNTDRDGYGRLAVESQWERAPRLAWSLTHGAIPKGLIVCHRCDNRPCCRPTHLYLGTAADNARDRSAAGSQTGSLNGFAKLTEPHVIEIKGWLAVGVPARDIAPRFGVSVPTIYAIRSGTIWSQVAA